MQNRVLSKLIKINLLYADPQITQKSREKGRVGKRLGWSLVKPHLLLGLLLLVFLGGMGAFLNFAKSGLAFSSFILLPAIITVAQSIPTLNNLFFESQDQTAYLPLPISQRQVFMAKLAVLFIVVMPLSLPMVLVFIFTGIQAGNHWLLASVIGLLWFVLTILVLVSFCTFLIFGLAKTKLYKRHHKLVMLLLLIITSGAMLVGYFYLGSNADKMAEGSSIRGMGWLYQLVLHPLTFQSVLGLVGGFIGVMGVAVLADRWLLPQLTVGNPLENGTATTKKHRGSRRSPRTFRQAAVTYQLKLIQNPTLLYQAIFLAIMPALVFAITMQGSYTRNQVIGYAGGGFWGVFLVGGIIFGAMTIGSLSLLGVGISLERTNLSHLQSLPINLKGYLQMKFWSLYAIQASFVELLMFALCVWIKLPMISSAALLIGLAFGIYLCGLFYFARDWRLFSADWSNVTQLFNRGGGSAVTVLLMFGWIGWGVLGIGLSFTMIKALGGLVGNLINIAVIALVAGLIIWRYRFKFWQEEL